MRNENEFIEFLKAKFEKKDTDLIYGIGDDCAVFKKTDLESYLITVDGLKEGIHFFKEEKMETIISKLFVRNISDIYAMGGIPKWALIYASVPRKLIQDTTDAILDMGNKFNINIIGGDTTIAENKTFTMTLIGTQKNEYIYYRSGAEIGDRVYLSSYTGLAYWGRKIIENNILGFDNLKNRYYYFNLPSKRFLSHFLLNKNITAAIDISDGILKDAERLALSSNVKIILNNKQIPIHRELVHLKKREDIDLYKGILAGGDDYEILFTSREKLNFGVEIGKVVTGKGLVINSVEQRKGYDHFEK